jgi:hypothetical protein
MDVKIRIDSIAGEQMKGRTYAIGARRLHHWQLADGDRVTTDLL